MNNKCRPKLVQGLRRGMKIRFQLPAQIFKIIFNLYEEMNQMVNNNKNKNNSSNSLVFSQWPQTKMIFFAQAAQLSLF